MATSAVLTAPRRTLLAPAVRFAQQPIVVLAVLVLITVVLSALLAQQIAPYNPATTDAKNRLVVSSSAHLLGTDQIGRDILSRLIYGARVSLQVGFGAVGLAICVGVPIGTIAGYYSKSVFDHVAMRFVDAVLAFPDLILALTIVAIFGPGTKQIMLAIAAGTFSVYARLARGEALVLREQAYIDAARSIGARTPRVLIRHIVPNLASPIIVQGSLGVGYAILTEAGLSFLGVGARPPTATWGGMLSEGLGIMSFAPHLALYAGFTIFVVVLAINIVGDTARDVLDPRLRGAR